jgi:hypothetical protein
MLFFDQWTRFAKRPGDPEGLFRYGVIFHSASQ